jgi:hypothetical protein
MAIGCIVCRPDQEHFPVVIQLRCGLRDHLRKGLPRLAVNLKHSSDRVTGWKDPAETRRHQKITPHDVSAIGEIG